MKLDGKKRDYIGFALSCVITNEENVQCNEELSLEEHYRITDICKKIVDVLDKDEIMLLLKIRPEVATENYDFAKRIHEIICKDGTED